MGWNIVLPVILVFGLSFVFANERNQFTVGVLNTQPVEVPNEHSFFDVRYIDFVNIVDRDTGFRKVSRHQLDLLVEFGDVNQYWVNPESPKGYFAELALLQSDANSTLQKQKIVGDAIRYVDWVLPGILGMNMMFSCLFGVGYVVVRYRKNGFLKRLRATPLRSIEFVIAQVASRLLLILAITAFVYAGTHYFLDTRMEGSLLTLFLVALLGAVSLISLGLLVAARVTSEELAGGLLNMTTWPMMMLSGVWFSLESAGEWVNRVANIFPLTHILSAAREIMIDGAALSDIASQLTILTAMSIVFLLTGAAIFRWRAQ